MTCWYDELQRRPPIYFGPLRCDTAVTHAERLGDGKQRFDCDAHARWRRADIPAAPVRDMRPGETHQ